MYCHFVPTLTSVFTYPGGEDALVSSTLIMKEMGKTKSSRLSSWQTVRALVLNDKGHLDKLNILIPSRKCTMGHFFVLQILVNITTFFSDTLFVFLCSRGSISVSPRNFSGSNLLAEGTFESRLTLFGKKKQIMCRNLKILPYTFLHLFFFCLYGFRNEITILSLMRSR